MEPKSSKTYIAIPPGSTIKEILIDRKMSQKEFAARMGYSEKHICKLLGGDVQLTYETAFRLESVLGTSADFWNKLEAIYREKLVKVQAENEMDEDISLSALFPYKEAARLGWIEDTRDPCMKVINLRKYFEVASLTLLDNRMVSKIAWRKLAGEVKKDYSLLMWAQKAKLEARAVSVGKLNIEKLDSLKKDIRMLTVRGATGFKDDLKNMLAKCGVALVILPHISGSFLHGAAFQDESKMIVAVSVRSKDADRFWFSLFHEIGHIVYGHTNVDVITEEDERTADAYARDALLPPESFEEFVSKRVFTKKAVLQYASSAGVDAGIVAGRLQHDNFINYKQLNGLKHKLSSAEL